MIHVDVSNFILLFSLKPVNICKNTPGDKRLFPFSKFILLRLLRKTSLKLASFDRFRIFEWFLKFDTSEYVLKCEYEHVIGVIDLSSLFLVTQRDRNI